MDTKVVEKLKNEINSLQAELQIKQILTEQLVESNKRAKEEISRLKSEIRELKKKAFPNEVIDENEEDCPEDLHIILNNEENQKLKHENEKLKQMIDNLEQQKQHDTIDL